MCIGFRDVSMFVVVVWYSCFYGHCNLMIFLYFPCQLCCFLVLSLSPCSEGHMLISFHFLRRGSVATPVVPNVRCQSDKRDARNCNSAHMCICRVSTWCEETVDRWSMWYDSYLFLCLFLLPVQVVLSFCIQVTPSLTFLLSPLLIISDGQLSLKWVQIYCATECAESFLGRWACTAEMERRRTARTNWVPLTL